MLSQVERVDALAEVESDVPEGCDWKAHQVAPGTDRYSPQRRREERDQSSLVVGFVPMKAQCR